MHITLIGGGSVLGKSFFGNEMAEINLQEGGESVWKGAFVYRIIWLWRRNVKALQGALQGSSYLVRITKIFAYG
jgi:hypothetical protein